MARILGIDFGRKRIGLALSDAAGIFAFPYKAITYKEQRQAIKEIVAVIKKEKAQAIVFGLPLSLAGKLEKSAQEAKKFAEMLKKELTIPIYLQDERFSTKEAIAYLKQKKKKISKEEKDCASACLILQTFLDRKKPI